MAGNGLRPEEIQVAIDREGAQWEAGPTPLTDLPVEEKRLYLGYVPGPNEPSLAEREQAAHPEPRVPLGTGGAGWRRAASCP